MYSLINRQGTKDKKKGGARAKSPLYFSLKNKIQTEPGSNIKMSVITVLGEDKGIFVLYLLILQ